MSWLLNSSFAQDIGLALVHSLWQIVLVAAVFAIANRLIVRRSASLRYVAAYSVLLLMLALPLVSLFVISADSTGNQDRVDVVAHQFEHYFPADAASETTAAYPVSDVVLLPIEVPIEPTEAPPIATPDFAEDSVSAVEPQTTREWSWILPWLSVGWSLGVIAFSLRPFLALHRCHQLRKQARQVEVPWITDTFELLCARIGLKCKVEIASSALVHVPTVMGFIRPIVLLPVSMVTGHTPGELS